LISIKYGATHDVKTFCGTPKYSKIKTVVARSIK
jgi:hypothetical protein